MQCDGRPDGVDVGFGDVVMGIEEGGSGIRALDFESLGSVVGVCGADVVENAGCEEDVEVRLFDAR